MYRPCPGGLAIYKAVMGVLKALVLSLKGAEVGPGTQLSAELEG